MLLIIAFSLIYVEIKNSIVRNIFTHVIVQVFNKWEVRTMVVLSLLLQVCLVRCADTRRKYRGKWLPIVEVTVWSVFLLADWMANVVLSILLRGEVGHKDVVIWTSFMIWHLGSPYNITAYTVEDNELWLRRGFGMLVQVGEALYILIKFKSPIGPLNFVAILIFVAGFLRYLERVLVLRSASQKQLRDSLTSKKDTSEETTIIRTGRINFAMLNEYLCVPDQISFLRKAHLSSIIHKPLFTQLPFRVSKEFHNDRVFINPESSEDAFRLVGAELHFFYDLLYTKISLYVTHYRLSFSLRIFCLLSAASSLLALAMIHKQRQSTNNYHKKGTTDDNENVDIMITYLLLVGAMALDAHSFAVDARAMAWTRIWLPISPKWLNSKLSAHRARRKLKSMGQHDLVDYYIKAAGTSKLSRLVKFIDMHTGNYFQIYWYGHWKPIDRDLKDFIFCCLKKKRNLFETENFKFEFLTKLLAEFQSDGVSKRKSEEKGVSSAEDKEWVMDTTDFTRCVFLWHIATCLVYYDDLDKSQLCTTGKYGKIGKSLSDYMMYLVLARPLMLPLGFSEATNRDTYKEAQVFFHNEMKANWRDARKQFTLGLLAFNPEASSFYHGTSHENFSALFKGCVFGKKLQALVSEHRWDPEEKWKFISEVWMDMMTYAAGYCSWQQHADQLRRGGELLTLVSLLMAHFGLCTHIRRSEEADEDPESNSSFLGGEPFDDF
ncbi:hypothetical protein PTKIN_Ptkin10aG0170100 [Pterospermum kingtungense]